MPSLSALFSRSVGEEASYLRPLFGAKPAYKVHHLNVFLRGPGQLFRFVLLCFTKGWGGGGVAVHCCLVVDVVYGVEFS